MKFEGFREEIKAGDIILYHGRSWLSRQILKWMNIYRKRKGLRERPLYNHVSVVVSIWGELYTVEAVARGVVMQPVEKSVAKVKFVKPKTWVNPLDRGEVRRFSKLGVQLATANIEYDVFNFLWQMLKILTGRWFGPTGAKARKRLYCSELAAVMMDSIRFSFGGHTADKNPLDIDLSGYLRDYV